MSIAVAPRDDLVTVAEAATLGRVTPDRVRQLVREGVLPGQKVDGRWMVRAGGLAAWLEGRSTYVRRHSIARVRPPRLRPIPEARMEVIRRCGRARVASGPRHPRVAAAPLLRLVIARGGPGACGARGGTAAEQALVRARRQGWLTIWAADELAVRLLGMSPLEVWGDEWLEAAN
ncbi:helix-turn-helix domain-containing protein [Nocardioides sp.]|uniref:helix-turn-helix domain-containing protein n=1 Tax=Nocardioides sp. TaxID=35761 RepID=UPI002CF0DCA3|nr:helix-turn-helix domain-containing protein [Nocardioides sp.]HSX68769.1 helix-turn-helix domain-containing protein [Nocardioides sp.]